MFDHFSKNKLEYVKKKQRKTWRSKEMRETKKNEEEKAKRDEKKNHKTGA